MVNFYPGFVVPEAGKQWEDIRALRARYPERAAQRQAMAEYRQAHPVPQATIRTVADHIDQIVKVAGIDHVGIGSDYDGIESVPVGLEDVSTYPRLTDELLRRNYSEADIHKINGGNALRALRKAGEVATMLQKTTRPEVDPVKPERD